MSAFQPSLQRNSMSWHRRGALLNGGTNDDLSSDELAYLKQELTAYLEKRKEVGADELAKK